MCYRQTRKFMQRIIKPGIKLIDMCEQLEETARTLVEANGLTAGGLTIIHVLSKDGCFRLLYMIFPKA